MHSDHCGKACSKFSLTFKVIFDSIPRDRAVRMTARGVKNISKKRRKVERQGEAGVRLAQDFDEKSIGKDNSKFMTGVDTRRKKLGSCPVILQNLLIIF